ncbi:MAG TPA: SBBP repeat-containing protein [Chitinophagales bacterium]|nr:SBBP repeat-containing protein [Chitinophagales bacterium]
MKGLLLILTISVTETLCAQSFEWARTGSGIGQDAGQRVTADKYGNIYVTGYFSGEAEFSGQDYQGNGIFDIFLAKYSGSGDLLWLKYAGSAQNDAGYGIAIDTSGYIYVTGYFTSVAAFGENASLMHLSSNGNTDIFLAKYDADGNLIWAKSAGGVGEDKAFNLVIDQFNNISITGFFSYTSLFGGCAVVSNGSTDAFIAQYDTAGNCRWAQSLGSSGLDKSFGIAVDSSGNSYITGFFYYAALLSNSSIVLEGDGLSSDIFICKYSPAGDVLLAERVGGPYNDASFGITLDKDKAIFITGYFLEEIDFGDCHLQNYRYNDIFIVKFDSTFNCEWANHEGGIHLDMGLDITVDRHGNVYVTGIYDSLGYFGRDTVFSVNYYDMFLCKYNNKGILLWMKSAGGNGGDFSKAVHVRSDGVIYLTGYYKYTCAFDGIRVPLSKEADIFVTKLSQPVGMEHPEPQPMPAISVYPNPNAGEFYIDAPFPIDDGQTVVSVFDISGKIILQQELRDNVSRAIALRQPAGVYIVKVESRTAIHSKRIVITQ